MRAFVWLRWRLLSNAFRSRGGRDLLARAARIGEVVAPFALALLVLPAALGFALLGSLSGWAAARYPERSDAIVGLARLVLGGLTIIVVIGPLIRSWAQHR